MDKAEVYQLEDKRYWAYSVESKSGELRAIGEGFKSEIEAYKALADMFQKESDYQHTKRHDLQTEIDGLNTQLKLTEDVVKDAERLAELRKLYITALEDVIGIFKIFISHKLGYTNFNNLDDDWKVRNALTKLNEGRAAFSIRNKTVTSGKDLKVSLAQIPASPQSEYQQLDEVNNRVELEKDNWTLRFKCCNCGLVHKMAFAIEDNGNLGIAIDRENPTPCPTAIRYTCSHCDVSVRVKILALTPKIIVDSTLLCKNCGKPFTHHRLEFN